jgi:two-component system CheB/CheR fusion protein
MLFVEQLEKDRKSRSLQIFASDVDTDALEVARAGLYPESISTDVAPERLRRFFSRRSAARVKKELRECVMFARQNL